MRREGGGRLWWALCLNTAVLFAFRSSVALDNTTRAARRPDADVVSDSHTGQKADVQAANELRPLSSALPQTDPSLQSWAWNTYHSHDVMIQYLNRLANNSSGACKLKYLEPTSVDGRSIVAIVVGSNATTSPNGLKLPKPTFTWIGNMHGDETANRELLLRLAAGLCTGELAAGDARWRALQAATVIHIIPSMNPDGFTRRRRYNSQNVDLNRNFWTSDFPYAKPTRAEALATTPWGPYSYPAAATWAQVGNFSLQPEGVAVSSHLLQNPPDLSANLHGGALVANYPMDACDSLGAETSCPSTEDPVTYLLAASYASANSDMAANSRYPFMNGTTQGADWYPVLGSLQDWVYHTLKRLHLTLELHEVKDPPASSLPRMWITNRRSMLRLMELTHMGLRGRVVDSVTRRSLAANITVNQPMGIRGTTANASRGGYFFKPMMPGVQYVLTVQPYDPANLTVSYGAMTVRVRLKGTADAAVYGGGLAGLTLERELLAVRRTGSTTRKMRR